MNACCEKMEEQVSWTCRDHPNLSNCPDSLIWASGNRKEYGLRIHDGGSSFVEIQFCPWCGASLLAESS